MTHPVKWVDEYYLSKDRIVLTENELHIPAVRVFAHHAMSSAISPLAPHYHEDCFEFTMIAEGFFTFQAGGEKHKVTGGDVFITYPDEPHGTDEAPLSHGEFYWVQLDVSAVRSLLFLNEQAARELVARLRNMQRHVVKLKDKMPQQLLKAAFQLTTTPDSRYLIASHLVLFLNLLMESAAAPPPSLSWNIYEATKYIADHVAQDISLDELARRSYLSTPHFKARFKQELGISPRSYINMQKIERAKTLLQEGKSITETAFCLHFNTSSYFAAVFKKYTFFTPSEYLLHIQ